MQLRIGSRKFAPALIPSLAFAGVLSVLLTLGNWQLDRAKEKQALVDDKQARQAAAPLRLGEAVVDPLLDRFRPAEVRGHYVQGQQWLLDNRLYRGQPGYHVFSQFEMQHGGKVLINRGWVSVGESRAFLPLLPLPEGDFVLTGHLDSPASVGLVLGEVPLASLEDRVLVQTLDIAALGQARDLPLQPLALVIDEGMPGGLQFDWQPVENISPEKHLGYAVQWFAMALALVIIYIGVNTRQQKNGGDE